MASDTKDPVPADSDRMIASANAFVNSTQLDRAVTSVSSRISSHASTASSNPFTDFNGMFFKGIGAQYSFAYNGSKDIDARMMSYARLIDNMAPKKPGSSIAKAHRRCKACRDDLVDYRTTTVIYVKKVETVDAVVATYGGNWAFHACLRDRAVVHRFISSEPGIQKIMSGEDVARAAIDLLTMRIEQTTELLFSKIVDKETHQIK